MPINICPNCGRRYSVYEWDVDFVHTCNSGKNSIDQEDVLKIDGPNAIGTPVSNKLRWTNAGLTGAKSIDRTVRGNPSAIYKQRQHEEYIEL